MKKTLRWLDVNFEAILMVLFFSLMILLVTVQVVLRFIFKTGFSWGEEVARLLFEMCIRDRHYIVFATPHKKRNTFS